MLFTIIVLLSVLTLYPRLSFAGCTQGDDVKNFNANNTVPSRSEGMVAVIVNWYNSTVVVPLLISAAVIMSSNPLIHPDSGTKTAQDSANTDVSEAQQRAVLSDLIDKAMTAASPSDFSHPSMVVSLRAVAGSTVVLAAGAEVI
jgi:hypothetical protein